MSKIECMTRKVQEKLESFAQFLGSFWITHNYDAFHYFDVNRPIEHYRPVEESIEIFGYQIRPADIAVIEGEIIILDGQARHYVAKKMNLPYYFVFHQEVVTREQAVRFIAAANAAQTKFKLENFGHLYSKDSKHYRQFEELMAYSYVEQAKPSRIAGSELVALMTNVRPGASFYTGNKAIIKAFKANDGFTFTKEDFDRAKHAIDFMKQIAPYLGCWTRREFITAFLRVITHKNFRIKTFVHAVTKVRGQQMFTGAKRKDGRPLYAKTRSKEDYGNAILRAYNTHTDEGHMITDICFEQEQLVSKKLLKAERYQQTKNTPRNHKMAA